MLSFFSRLYGMKTWDCFSGLSTASIYFQGLWRLPAAHSNHKPKLLRMPGWLSALFLNAKCNIPDWRPWWQWEVFLHSDNDRVVDAQVQMCLYSCLYQRWHILRIQIPQWRYQFHSRFRLREQLTTSVGRVIVHGEQAATNALSNCGQRYWYWKWSAGQPDPHNERSRIRIE